MTKHNQFIREILGPQTFVAVDVGARGGIPSFWEKLRGIVEFILFEPDTEAAKDLIDAGYEVFALGLDAAPGVRTLYYANCPGASLYHLNMAICRDYVPKIWRDDQTEMCHVDTLDRVLAGRRIDIAKLDAQGAELAILKGANEHLSDLLSVEMEVGIQNIYEGQGNLADAIAFMTAHDFELFDMHTSRAYLCREERFAGYKMDVFNCPLNAPSVSGRIWDSDVLFFKSAANVIREENANKIRRLCIAYCTYNYFSEAYALLERSAGILGGDAGPLKDAVITWHRIMARRWLYLTNPISVFVRRVRRKLRLDDQKRWCQYKWEEYPYA